MNEEGFRQWLANRGLADDSAATRLSMVRRIENVLPQLGIAVTDHLGAEQHWRTISIYFHIERCGLEPLENRGLRIVFWNLDRK